MTLLLSTVRRAGALLAGLAALALAAQAAAVENFRLSSLGTGTSPYIVNTTFANIVNEKLPEYQVQVNATGTATRHSVEAAMGRLDLFMLTPGMYYTMTRGIGPYQRVPNSKELAGNLRTLLNYPLGFYHVISYADSGIREFSQLKGKRVYPGPPGGLARTIAESLIKAVTGYEPGKDYEVVSLGWDAAAQSFQDGHIDVYVNTTLTPSPVIQQMALARDIYIIGIPDEAVNAPALQALVKRAGYRFDFIPPDAYGENQANTAPARAVASVGGIAGRKDLPEEAVYKMVKAFWENVDARKGSIPILKHVTLENVFLDLNAPLHPGAIRYYREIGLDIPPVGLGHN